MPDTTSAHEPEKRITNVAELDPKAAYPFKVAVYITPRVLGRAAIMDLRQSKTAVKNVVQNGQIGAATIAAVSHYFPLMFDEVHLITNFPDSRLTKHKIDLVITLDDVTATRQVIASETPTEMWDTRVYLGLYHPDGTAITHYTVTASSEHPPSEQLTNLDERIRWIFQTSQESVKPAMRLALMQFPKARVNEALQTYAATHPQKLSPADWQHRHQEFFEHLAKEKLNMPLPTMTLEQTFNRQTKNAADSMVMANALVLLNTKIFSQFYSRNPGAFNQDIKSNRELVASVKGIFLHQLQDLAEERDPNKRPFVYKNIGGQRKHTMSHAKTAVSAPIPTPTPTPTPTPAKSITPSPPVTSGTPTAAPVGLIKVYALLRSLNNAGKPVEGNSAGDCLADLRRTKDDLMNSAKENGSNSQLLHSAGSGATVYSKNLCTTAVPSKLDATQNTYETQRVTLCGIQTINCALAKTFAGMECQQALRQCRTESPVPKF